MPEKVSCAGCRDGADLDFGFTMAFQPIVDLGAAQVWGYEALVRGPEGESAASVLRQVDDASRYRFDQAARVRAIGLAGRLFPRGGALRLSINFMPNAVYEPAACIRASLAAARSAGLPTSSILFEFTEDERLDVGHVSRIIAEYRRQGFITGLDDFGSGYAGLGLLASFQPDLIKIDMHLIRGIDTDGVRQAIIAGLVGIARALDLLVIAEGIETEAEVRLLRSAGISLFQGYYFARPALERLPEVAHLGGTAAAVA